MMDAHGRTVIARAEAEGQSEIADLLRQEMQGAIEALTSTIERRTVWSGVAVKARAAAWEALGEADRAEADRQDLARRERNASIGPGLTLMQAAKQGLVGALVRNAESGHDLDATDSSGRTALMVAAAEGQAGTFAALLLLGADATLQDRTGQTALMLAAASGQEAVLHSLTTLTYGFTGDQFATQLKGHGLDMTLLPPEPFLRRKFKLAVDAADEKGETALMKACASGNPGAVWLCNPRVNANYRLADKRGQTALMHAARNGQDEVIRRLADFELMVAEGDVIDLGPSATNQNFLWYQAQTADGDGVFPLAAAEGLGHKKVAAVLRKFLEAQVESATKLIAQHPKSEAVPAWHKKRAALYRALGESEKADADLAAAGEKPPGNP
jgi:ankyrin repeat protein